MCKRLGPSTWHYWNVMDAFKRWDHLGRFRSLGMPVKGTGRHHSLFCFPHSELSSFFCRVLYDMLCCLNTGTKAVGPTEHGLKPPKVWAKINLSS
jgi:hypothetical protein